MSFEIICRLSYNWWQMMTISPLRNPIKLVQIFKKSGEITLKKNPNFSQFTVFKSKEGRGEGLWSRQSGWLLLTRLLFGSEQQSSEVRDSCLGFQPCCWNTQQATSPPFKQPSDVHPLESLCPPFFLPVRATHLSKQRAGSNPLLILYLPLPLALTLFSSLPSSSFKGTVHPFIMFFTSLFHLFSYTFSTSQHYVTTCLNFEIL